MRFFVGSDHAAIELRGLIARHLIEAGHEVDEIGPQIGERVDYPDQAGAVARQVAASTGAKGILVCGTGIGMSIAANKVPGIRAALVHDPFTAEMAAMHNDANILCLGARLLADAYVLHLIDIWLATEFETRHSTRLNKIAKLETPS
jgi:ribose 5-phosphate isomerase B